MAKTIGPGVCSCKSSTNSWFDVFYVGATDSRIYWGEYIDATSTQPAHRAAPLAMNGWTKAQPASMYGGTGPIVEPLHTGTEGAIYYKRANSPDTLKSSARTSND